MLFDPEEAKQLIFREGLLEIRMYNRAKYFSARNKIWKISFLVIWMLQSSLWTPWDFLKEQVEPFLEQSLECTVVTGKGRELCSHFFKNVKLHHV